MSTIFSFTNSAFLKLPIEFAFKFELIFMYSEVNQTELNSNSNSGN